MNPNSDFDTILINIRQNLKSNPTFYYLGIGTANHNIEYPIPANRHELPDYILELDYPNKVLILIDPATTTPLINSPYNLVQINNNMYKIIESNIEIDIYVIRSMIYIDQDINFLYELIKLTLSSNPDTLLMVSTYTGILIYHMQDMIINLFNPDEQTDIRSRFLLDSKYFKDLGCRYDLTDPLNQPIIIDNRFYNHGYLTPKEFNEELQKTYLKSDIISLQIKSYLRSLFEIYIDRYLDHTYISYRRAYNETIDIEDKKYFRNKMLEHINILIDYIRSFINVEEFINKLKNNNVYYDINEIRNIMNTILY